MSVTPAGFDEFDSRLDQSQPPPLPRLRAPHPHRRSLRPARHDPRHAQAMRRNSLDLSRKFPDGLLEEDLDQFTLLMLYVGLRFLPKRWIVERN